MNMQPTNSKYTSYKWVLFVIFVLVILFWQFADSSMFDKFSNENQIKEWVKQLGLLGPFAIILLIAMAIVISPIPSAPVALVSGAVFGHILGTIYVVIGAVTGAIVAFTIARKLGYEYVNKKISAHLPVKLVGSQNTLMLIVFFTRLAPFISFDIISYAAGLTQLTFFRFILASFFGILPISFLLAHLGSEASNGEMQGIAFALLFLGVLTIISMLIHSRKRK